MVADIDNQEFIRLWDEGKPETEIASRFDVSRSTITNMVRKLGLRHRHREWSDHEIAYLRSAYPTESLDEIATVLGRSVSALKDRAQKMDLLRNFDAVFGKGRAELPPWTDTEKAYIAGIIDGEGAIQMNRSCVRLSVTVIDEDLVRWLSFMFGARMRKYVPRNPKHHEQFAVYAYGTQAYRILSLVLPYLRIKRKNAETVVQYWEWRTTRPASNLSKEDREIRHGFSGRLVQIKGPRGS